MPEDFFVQQRRWNCLCTNAQQRHGWNCLCTNAVSARLSSFQGESAVFALTLTGQLDNNRIIVAERLITVELAPAKTSFSRQRLAEPLPASVQLSSETRQCKLAESEHHRDERPKGDGRRPRVDSLQARDGSEAGR